MNLEILQNELSGTIRTVPDFPKPGIQFKDITTLINNAKAFNMLMEFLEERYKKNDLDFIAGIESRGFIFGAALATRLKKGFVPIRKKGKLPFTSVAEKYVLEYGFDEVEIHIDAFRDIQKAKVLLIDDLIATGGTAEASVKLINSIGGNCVEACFLLRLLDFDAVDKIKQYTKVFTILDI
ncbi:adenine phosphoribosyltransferase [Helicobacter sp. MIT 99-5507]|uniref:adenine phosphoribosyltransferase n=1 Tax=Helicobacter sp. MIT 99-5507 TaxID=152489 RepID=UPI000E1ED209|nr:adenine phosphoribosyltransferase [Helicobacter sp. MIT 99-5507]RDU56694.1 adenine phosphoribosyltransferase [Helicobacter sp. MIT 99-5507]